MILGWGESLRKAWISRRLLTCIHGDPAYKCLKKVYLTAKVSLKPINYLLQAVKMVFHAFYGYILAVFYTLCLKNLGEGTFALLGY